MTTHDHTPGAPHDHVEFSTGSMVSARVCDGCYSYVLGTPEALAAHQEFHDRVARLEAARPAPKPKKKSKKG